MNNGAKAAAALLALAGWVVLVVATASAFSVGASLWLSLPHASLADTLQTLPWQNAVWALAAAGAWLGLRKLRLRLEARISAEPEPRSLEAREERLRSGRIYQWFLIVVTSVIVLTAWSLHGALAASRERFNEILLWLFAAQALLTAGTFAFFAYGVDIRQLFRRRTGPSRNESSGGDG
ncbi:hypothetical protein [Methylacidimicrobium sp. B4]|uniref:hypothetical protein n=1 Tax=Methylacidimicrobium sp. B4 TaxID=2796139 RepID=UPI001A8E9F21|nr:hypothetical protein [Methylacidimicrobium sp. B4]QSR85273.1 hypothetical protein MacB4_03180 [Methylacidimicrobium sp. B4]